MKKRRESKIGACIKVVFAKLSKMCTVWPYWESLSMVSILPVLGSFPTI